jgi:predicted O-linked N-acetylglucosamine transferase (SPINDLY family)
MTDHPDHKALLKKGLNEISLGKPSAAAATFEAALAAKPDFLPARKALSQAYYMEGRYAEAVAVSEAVIAAEPGDPANALNHGVCLYGAGEFATAAASLARGMESKYATLSHRVLWLKCLIQMKAFDAALEAMAHVRASGANAPDIDLLDLELRQKTNAWGDFEALLARVADIARLPGAHITPSASLYVPAFTGADQRKVAEAWSAKICAAIVPLPPAAATRNPKIRLGYLSPDLQQKHPMGRHFRKVLAAHDRNAFEVIGYSLRPKHERSSAIYAAFDRLHFVEDQSDAAIAQKIRDDEIEILADLGMHTDGARARILAFRPAPVQVGFIGHGGTTGAAFMDYMITYAALMQAASPSDFTEATATARDPFLNGAWDRPEPQPISRKAMGVADDAVLFCSFCANTKITPDIFDVWLRLLQEVPGSFLWLRDCGPISIANLTARAAGAGVAPERLMFAPDESPSRFFGRLQCADLFLDTAPYSAGSSATDAVWAGLPLVTWAGETYVSRMAASVLIASGLPDLVTTSLDGYFAKALELAHDRPARARIRAHLLATRGTNPLFDAVGFTRRLETLYRKMSERSRRGEGPAPLSV